VTSDRGQIAIADNDVRESPGGSSEREKRKINVRKSVRDRQPESSNLRELANDKPFIRVGISNDGKNPKTKVRPSSKPIDDGQVSKLVRAGTDTNENGSKAVDAIDDLISSSSESEQEEREILTVSDPIEQEKIIRSIHSSLTFGHLGINKTTKRLKNSYNWKGMDSQIKQIIASCPTCQKFKAQKNRPIQMSHGTLYRTPWKCIFMDHMVLPECQGYKYVLVVLDSCTRFVVLKAAKDRTAQTLADMIIEVFSIFGFSDYCVTDNAQEMHSKVITKLMKLLNINHVFTTPMHQQANAAENAVGWSKTLLRTWLAEASGPDKSNWVQLLPWAMRAMNLTENRSGFSPYSLLFGRPGREIFCPKLKSGEMSVGDFYEKTANNIRSMNKVAAETFKAARAIDKKYYDINTCDKRFEVGELVLLKSIHKEAFAEKFLGPFEVSRIVSNENVEIKRGKKFVVMHKNLLIKFRVKPEPENLIQN
jgi:hypothetical protein